MYQPPQAADPVESRTRPWWWRCGFLLYTISWTLAVPLVGREHTTEGDHASFFLGVALLTGFIAALAARSAGKALERTVSFVTYWLMVYMLFVSYQNRPWFAEEPPGGCDGACFGWYTFEFDPPYITLVLLGLLSLLLGLALKGLARLIGLVLSRAAR